MDLKIYATKFQTFLTKYKWSLKITSFFLIWILILVTLPTIIYNQCRESILFGLIWIRYNPCLKGTCIPGFYSFSCDCVSSWSGEYCDHIYWKDCPSEEYCQVQISSEIPVYNSKCESTGKNTTTNVIFQMFYDRVSWSEAKDKCEKRGNGTTLAAFYSDEEVALVDNNFPTLAGWIGGYATKNSEVIDDRSWKWVAGLDGNGSDPICYSHWFWNEPNGFERDENCIERMYEGRWNDIRGDTNLEYTYSYICQIRW